MIADADSQEAVEIVNHIISGCKLLFVDDHYTKRDIGVGRYVYSIIKKFWINKWHNNEHEQKNFNGNSKVIVFYNTLSTPGR